MEARFNSQRTRRSPGHSAEIPGELGNRLSRAFLARVDRLARDRQDAARWAKAGDAVIKLTSTKGNDTQQGPHVTSRLVGNAGDLAELQGTVEPRGSLGKVAVEHVDEGDQPQNPDRPESLFGSRVGAELESVVLLLQKSHRLRGSLLERLGQLLQRVLVFLRGEGLDGKKHALVQLDPVDVNPRACAGGIGVWKAFASGRLSGCLGRDSFQRRSTDARALFRGVVTVRAGTLAVRTS